MSKQSKPHVSLEALGPIRHDGDTYAEGDALSVDETAAEALVASGAAKVKGRAPASLKPAQETAEQKAAAATLASATQSATIEPKAE